MQLPSGSQTWLSVGADNAWTLHEYLTAALVDAVNVGNWQRGGDPKVQPPTPIRRPADMRQSGAVTEQRGARARAFLERQKRSQTTEPEEA